MSVPEGSPLDVVPPELTDPFATQSEDVDHGVSDRTPAHVTPDARQGGDSSSLPPAFVFAVGRIEPRFPSLAVEKEVAQAIGRSDGEGLTDRQALQSVLSDRSNRYLVRQLAWVLTIEGLEAYLLVPRDPGDFDLLIEAVRADPGPTDTDVVIGSRGSLAPPEAANGLVVPYLLYEQIFSFDQGELVNAIPRPESLSPESFEPAARELYTRLVQLADNSGATDEHRALNFLAVRYPAIYARATEELGRNSSLAAVRVLPSRLSGVRNIVDAVFTFRDRGTDVETSYFARVDVTELFPFLVTRLAPYIERS